MSNPDLMKKTSLRWGLIYWIDFNKRAHTVHLRAKSKVIIKRILRDLNGMAGVW